MLFDWVSLPIDSASGSSGGKTLKANRAKRLGEFFKQRKAHSAIKTAIVTKYFPQWLRIIKTRTPSKKRSEEMERSGTLQTGSPCRPYAEAKSVRVRDGERQIGAGLFGEVQERIAGFDIIYAPDLDAAIEVAASHPMAKFGAIEVRELRALG